MSTATTAKPLTSRQGVEEALDRFVRAGAEEVTTREVQERAAKIAPAVKDGYAAFWLAKFVKEGVHVERVKRGEYRLVDAKPAPSADELAAQHTAKELRELAEREGVEVAKSATKVKIAQILAGAL